jgi:hypothetical protein
MRRQKFTGDGRRRIARRVAAPASRPTSSVSGSMAMASSPTRPKPQSTRSSVLTTRPRAAPCEGRRQGSGTGRLRIADGCGPCVSVIKVSNHSASRLGLGRVGRAPRNRARREDCAQRGERTLVVAVAGSVARCVWRRLGGNWRRALRVHDCFLRDGRRCRCEGANRRRRQ